MMRIAVSGIVLIFLYFSSLAFSGSYSITLNSRIYKGAAAYSQGEVIKIQTVSKNSMPFKIIFNGREYPSFLYGKYQAVLIGIDYQLHPGTYTLRGYYNFNPELYYPVYHKIRVKEKYPRLRNAHLIQREENELKKIALANKQKEEISVNLSPRSEKFQNFVRPVVLGITDRFGSIRRCWDKIKKRNLKCRYHLGTDYRAARDKSHRQPVKISAINSGRAIFADENEVDGKIVVIDHGNGISSGYLHLSRFFVKKGARVKAGQKIGLAGQSGNADAVHLHFFIKMDNGKTIVDPEKFFEAVIK